MSFGKSNKTGTENKTTNTQTDPWAPAQPYLKELLASLGKFSGNYGPTPEQMAAFDKLKANNAGPTPWLGEVERLTNDTFGTKSRAGMLDDAYGTMRTNLGDVAAGKNQDILSDPRLQAMLKTVGDDTQNRIQGIFAGAGRDVVGNASGQGAIARGSTAAQLPILMQEYARQQGRTDAANQSLFGAGRDTAAGGQALDKDALATRAGGTDLAKMFMQFRDMPENTKLALAQQIKDMPFEDMSQLARLLLPIAGLGGTQHGTSTGTSKSQGTTVGIDLSEMMKKLMFGAG